MKDDVLTRIIGSMIIATIGKLFVPPPYIAILELVIAALLGEAVYVILFGGKPRFPKTLGAGLVFGVFGGLLGGWVMGLVGLPGLASFFGGQVHLHANGAVTTSGFFGLAAAFWDLLVIGVGSLLIAFPVKIALDKAAKRKTPDTTTGT